MDYNEIELLLSTYAYCKDDAKNCNDCPWVKNKGNCDFDEDEWSLKLYEACWELIRTVENLRADISALQEDNSRLEQDNKELTEENKNLGTANEEYRIRLIGYNKIIEQRRSTILAQREIGRQQALEIYHKSVRIAELTAKLSALPSEEEEAW